MVESPIENGMTAFGIRVEALPLPNTEWCGAMGHVSLKVLLQDANARRYAVPTFWCGSVEKVLGHIRAAEASRAPLCLCCNLELWPELPIEIGIPLIVSAAEQAEVPIATILDHGKTLETVTKAIFYGVSSVMFDGSHLLYQDNIRQTREVTQIAHAVGVSVEAELGAVGGSAIETGGTNSRHSVTTDPVQARDFVEQTGIDALAISFGNVHGQYQGEPILDLERVRKIGKLVSIPLVMHGASGLHESEYRAVIASGICKLNYHTSMSRGADHNLQRRVKKSQSDIGWRDIQEWNMQFYQKETRQLLDLFGCTGKADGLETKCRQLVSTRA